MEKIKSPSELVNALSKGIEILKDNEVVSIDEFEDWSINRISHWCNIGRYQYSEPVEVVELWGEKTSYRKWFFSNAGSRSKNDTHKQTQIIQNGEIIWTEIEKI